MTDAVSQLTRAQLAKLGADKAVTAELLAALEGHRETAFDRDGRFTPHRHGPARQQGGVQGFDESHFWAGAMGLAFAAAQLAVGDPLREALPRFYETMQARLENPDLLFSGGFPVRDRATLELLGDPLAGRLGAGGASGAVNATSGGKLLRRAEGQVYLRPAARLEHHAESHAELLRCCWPAWTAGQQWTSPYRAWLTFRVALPAVIARVRDTPLSPGQHEADPRASVPELHDAARAAHDLPSDAATLYLQLATLCDCTDRWLRAINAWTATRHGKAIDALVAKRLVVAERKPRAGRKVCLPGAWEALAAPQPAMEASKLQLYGVVRCGEVLAAPLGRVVALQPLHELFARAWAALRDREGGGVAVVTEVDERDWLAEIRAAPDDDEPRRVYADWLIEQGDARGELIVVQCDLRQAANTAAANTAGAAQAASSVSPLREREAALLATVGSELASAIQPYVEDYRIDRGFVVSVTARPQVLAKRAALFAQASPLLEQVVLCYGGGVGRIPDQALDSLAASPLLAQLRHLDFSPNHFPGAHAFARLLASKQLQRLHTLRLGFNRKGSGIGKTGARAIANSAALSELRELALPGQRLGPSGGMALLLGAGGASRGSGGSARADRDNLSRLERLDLAYNSLEDEHGEALLEALSGGAFPALCELQLENRLAEGAFENWQLDVAHNRISEPLAAKIRATLR
jgi:uncharacterized protein (TIGR02996 family)